MVLRLFLSQIAKFMGPKWRLPGSCRPQVGPMLAPWILLSGITAGRRGLRKTLTRIERSNSRIYILRNIVTVCAFSPNYRKRTEISTNKNIRYLKTMQNFFGRVRSHGTTLKHDVFCFEINLEICQKHCIISMIYRVPVLWLSCNTVTRGAT